MPQNEWREFRYDGFLELPPDDVSADRAEAYYALSNGVRRHAPQYVQRLQRAVTLEMPEGPAVAGRRVLHQRADLVDRAAQLARHHRAVRRHHRGHPALPVVQAGAGRQQPALHQAAERDARRVARGGARCR
jgi:hypothetical protein